MAKLEIPRTAEIFSDPRYARLAALLREINKKWAPHAGQKQIGQAIFSGGKRRIGVECGRKFGKTELAIDLCWRLGNMIQGGQIYYYGAYTKAVREFLWAPERLQRYGPQDYIRDIHKTDMRLTFVTDTFVKLDGADEFKGAKGINPDVLIADEAADYSDDFWNAMMPNLASKDAIILILTSPPWKLEDAPEEPVYFIRLMDLWKKYMKDGEKAGKPNKYAYYNMPTSVNEHISKEWLNEERKTLVAMGLKHEYEREYEAKRVTGGGKKIIGTFDRDRHVFPHAELMKKIEKDITILQWTTIVDPSQSAFGELTIAVNPYSKEVYWLGEILEREENETTEQLLWPRIQKIEEELYPGEDMNRFLRVCDEAARWWIVGCATDPGIGVSFEQTEKALNSIEMGLSLLRTIFFLDKGYVSDRCVNFIFQIENWKKDKKGNFPKLGDDLLDCLSGSTLVDTTKGQFPIASLIGKKGRLFSRDGLVRRFFDVRKTHSNVDTYTVSFEDGRSVTATPNHRFLTDNGEWKRLDCLLHGELIQCATYESQHNLQNGARIQREGLSKLSWKKILYSWAKSLTPHGVGTLEWAYPERASCPSYEWGLEGQSAREPLSSYGKAAYPHPSNPGANTADEREHNSEGHPRGSRLALFEGGACLAQSSRKRDHGLKASIKKTLRTLWQEIQNHCDLRALLPSKLQNESKTAKIKNITYAGKADTFCLQVEETQAFSVEGGIIVHNCSRYGLHVNGYYISRDDKPAIQKLHPREERHRLRRDMELEVGSLEENDLAQDLLGFAHEDDDELNEDEGRWN